MCNTAVKYILTLQEQEKELDEIKTIDLRLKQPKKPKKEKIKRQGKVRKCE